MITVISNIDEILGGRVDRLNAFINLKGGDMLRAVALSMLPVVHDRIHVQGKASDGSQIGTYSKGYMVVRTGAFKNAVMFKKGKNKGKIKSSGVFTDKTITLNKQAGVFSGEEKVGTARPNYNRSSDTKVILSLTRQMEDDFSVIADESKGYGLGFHNDHNFDKSQWAEITYKKKIYQLTKEEQDLAVETAKEFVIDALLK